MAPARTVGSTRQRLAQRRAGCSRPDLTSSDCGSNPAALTVRGLCLASGRRSPLLLRKFHGQRRTSSEQVYDWVIADIATTTQAAVAATSPDEQAPRGDGQHRPLDRRRSCASDGCCSAPSWPTRGGAQARGVRGPVRDVAAASTVRQRLGLPDDERRKASSHFAVGGVGQAHQRVARGRRRRPRTNWSTSWPDHRPARAADRG